MGRLQITLLLAVLAGPAGARTDPRAISLALDAAWRARDLEGVAALFAEGATLYDGMGRTATGRAAIRAAVAGAFADRLTLSATGRREVRGARVTWTADFLAGDVPLRAARWAVVAGGRLVEVGAELDEASRDRLEAARRERLRGLYRAFVAEVLNAHNPARLEALVAPDVVDHTPRPGQPGTADGFRRGFADLMAAFPDMKTEVVRLAVDEDLVAGVLATRGTWKGPLAGQPGNGRTFTITELRTFRFRDGRIVESWGLADRAALDAQLGLSAPAAPPSRKSP